MDRNEFFKRLVAQDPEEEQRVTAAAEYYREMRAALDETDFRWLEFGETRSAATRLRRERIAIYRRYRKLFELEISRPVTGLSQKAALLRYRAMLALASLLFRFAIPGALDLCDAAVFRMVRIAYLQATR
ncbi:MAG TPA: hypothetical protein VGK64_07735 [Bryobacteraceae bacterium]